MKVTQEGPILLVIPPFHSTTRPALGASQLKASCEAGGFKTELLYLNVFFAEQLGPNVDNWIAGGTTDVMLGEYIFSYLLFERSEKDLEGYVDEILAGSGVGKQLLEMMPHRTLYDTVLSLIRKADSFVQSYAIEAILSKNPWLVGMSSTFQQNCASLLLLKAIKKRRPEIITVLGGANCESTMGKELFARFPQIDYVGQGECDYSFPELVRSLRNGESETSIPGILSRSDWQSAVSPRLLQGDDLDRLPYPDFQDYFAQLDSVTYKNRVIPGLVMETSRGCWWGAKSQCSFCGMNGESMNYRSKSAPRALEEMTALVKHYGIPRLYVADNVLDMKYFGSVLPHLADQPVAEIFYETKASLSRKQVELLAQSGIRWIQPGIESLSDNTLKLMHKGASALRSIELLKLCAEYGIRVTWNHLYGVPGESDEEISAIAALIESIHHLEPPSAVGIIDMVRFSPYFVSPEKYGLEPNAPKKYYSHIYPFSVDSLKRLAYFYQTEFFSHKAESDAYKRLREVVTVWKQAYHRSHVIAVARKDSLVIIDTRSCAPRLWHRLTGMSRKIYEYCEKPCTMSSILAAHEPGAGSSEIQSILQSLVDDRLLLHVNGRYLSLATDLRRSYKEYGDVFPGGRLNQEKSANQFERYFRAMLSLNISFADAAGAFRKKSSAAWGNVVRKLLSASIRLVARLLGQENRQGENSLSNG